MKKLVLALALALVCIPAYAQEYFAHAGDSLNTGATTSKIWCSVAPAVVGRGSISIATNGTVQATETTAFSGMTVEAVHASNLYKRTGLYYYALNDVTKARYLATVSVKTDGDTITVTDGNRASLTAATSLSWGYWVTSCQRLLTSSDPNNNDDVYGLIPASMAVPNQPRKFGITFQNLYHTPDTATTFTSWVMYGRYPVGWHQLLATATTALGGRTTSRQSISVMPTFVVLGDATIGLSVGMRTEAADNFRPIVSVIPY